MSSRNRNGKYWIGNLPNKRLHFDTAVGRKAYCNCALHRIPRFRLNNQTAKQSEKKKTKVLKRAHTTCNRELLRIMNKSIIE
jgi:hypothetical protein